MNPLDSNLPKPVGGNPPVPSAQPPTTKPAEKKSEVDIKVSSATGKGNSAAASTASSASLASKTVSKSSAESLSQSATELKNWQQALQTKKQAFERYFDTTLKGKSVVTREEGYQYEKRMFDFILEVGRFAGAFGSMDHIEDAEGAEAINAFHADAMSHVNDCIRRSKVTVQQFEEMKRTNIPTDMKLEDWYPR